LNINSNDRIHEPRRLKPIVVQNLVFVVLFVLSLFGNVTEFKSNARPTHADQTCFESNDSHNGPRHSHDLPFDSKDSLPSEKTNEKDLEEEEIDDEDGKEYWHRSITPGFAYISTESSRLHCRQLFQNHHSVSLFILYHSWKSYLS